MQFVGGFLVGAGVATYAVGWYVWLQLRHMFIVDVTSRLLVSLVLAFPAFLIVSGILVARRKRRFA
jgi:hypothetical protein